MKFTDYFKIAIQNVKNDKKKKYFILIFIISSSLILIALLFSQNYLNYVNQAITNNIGFRTIMVQPKMDKRDYGLEELKKLNNVVDIHSGKYDYVSLESSFKNNNLDGNIDFEYGSNQTLPNNIVGTKFKEEDSNVAICPIDFYPSSSIYEYDIKKENILNGYDLLGTTFNVNYYSYLSDEQGIWKDKEYAKTFKIIGLYNNKETMNMSNTCYISKKDMESIINVQNLNKNSVPSFMVVVDNIFNIKEVSKKLSELGFSFDTKNDIDTNLVNIITLSSKIIITLILLVVILVTLSYVKKKIRNERKIIGVLKSCGYRKKVIMRIYILELMMTILFSVGIGTLISTILFLILKNTLFQFLIYFGFVIQMLPSAYFISILLMILIPIVIGILDINKETKNNIINLMRKEK